MKVLANWFLIFSISFSFSFLHGKENSPELNSVGSPFIYADLKKGDSRETVLGKLRNAGFIQIYEERDKGLVKCSISWDQVKFQLVCKLVDDSLKLCLIEGQRGWQDFFYEDVVKPEWEQLREKLKVAYGEKRKKTSFPSMEEVPLDDMGGFVTDTWDLEDRLIMLTIQLFMVKDCCTERMLQFSCCTMLIQPK